MWPHLLKKFLMENFIFQLHQKMKFSIKDFFSKCDHINKLMTPDR